MPQTVEIPDHGIAEFPDDMTPDQIKGVIQSKFYATPTPQPTATPQSGEVAPPQIDFGGAPSVEEQRTMLANVPQSIQKPFEAAVETVGSFIPHNLEQAAQMAASLTPIGPAVQTYRAVQSITQGRPLEALAGIPIAQRIPEIQSAEQTPAFSKERYKAGFGTLADLLMVGGIGAMARGAAPVSEVQPRTTAPTLTETLFGKEQSPLTEAVNQGLTEAERYGTQPQEIPNASTQQITTTPDGGLRTRSGMGELPQGNVETADARLRSDQGIQTPETRQGPEAGTQEAANVVPQGEVAAPQVVGRQRQFSPNWDERGDLQAKAMMSPEEFARFQYGTIPPKEVLPTLEANHAQVVADALANGLEANPEAIRRYGLEPAPVPAAEAATTAANLPELQAERSRIVTRASSYKQGKPNTLENLTGKAKARIAEIDSVLGKQEPVAQTGAVGTGKARQPYPNSVGDVVRAYHEAANSEGGVVYSAGGKDWAGDVGTFGMGGDTVLLQDGSHLGHELIDAVKTPSGKVLWEKAAPVPETPVSTTASSIPKTEGVGAPKEEAPSVADFKETQPSSPQSLGIVPRPSEFVKQDVAPIVRGISKGIQQIRAALTPANVSPIAGQTARIVREQAGQLARDRHNATTSLLDAAKALRRNTPAENLAIIDRLEKGQPVGNAALNDYKTIRQEAYDQRIKQVQDVNPNALKDLIENYFPHLWTRESIEKVQGNLANIPPDNPWGRIFGKRPLAGPGSFLKQRGIPTTAEGIALGLQPVTTNPVALDLLKMHEMDRYVMGHKIMQELKDNGLAKFVPAGERPDFGYTKIDDRIAQVYGPRGWKIVDEEGRQVPGQKVLGAYYAPEDAARIINNYLSPGLRGNAVYDGFRAIGNTMNQVQLGISAYHAFFTAIDSATSTIALGLEKVARSGGSPKEIAAGAADVAKGFTETPVGSMIENLWRGNKFLREYSKPGTTNAELAQVVDAAVKGGARVKMDTFYDTGAVAKFNDALKTGNYTGAVLRAPLALIQAVSKPLMEYTVPRLKLGIISQNLQYELSKLPKEATTDQVRTVAARVVDSVDNRMGQLIYDNLFWNKTLKDGLMASVRSVGWNLGDIRELGGGALDSITAPKRAYDALTKGSEIAGNPVFTKRMAYTFALPFYVAVLGSIYQYLQTGKGPESVQDMFMPRTGRRKPDGSEERVMLPTYMKDVYPLAASAGREGITGLISRGYRMAVNKLHPAISTIGQMIHNQDYYGNQILSPDDPLIQQHPTMGKIYREAQFIGKSFQPFSFRGVAQREGGLKEKVQAVAGIMPAPRELTDTPAMRMIHDINLSKRPAGGYTMLQQQKREDKRKASTGEDLRPLLFKRLSKDEKARVLEVATPSEKAIFGSGSQHRR